MITTFLKKICGKKSAVLPELPRKTEEMSREDIGRLYARVFSSADGQKVLEHMQRTTFMRSLGSECSDAVLRHIEGQRYFVQQIARLAEAGRQ